MNDKPSIDSIFCTAVEIESTEARESHLQRFCGEDPELRRQVDRLLEAHYQGGSILDSPPHQLDLTIASRVSAKPGTQIGPYKLLEQIGEGGMGLVFMAEQREPVRRKVALKIIKPGMDSRQVVARFESERQALAIMSHPNIAKVLDAGTTETGLPYFVMELVKGVPINEFCDQQQLSTRDRLDLFVTVCRAVQHAHQKGIIHRDLKPTNILVELHDVTPVPKVIDFGVAKATNQQLTEQSLHTGFSQLLGTPLYMSPEQTQLSGLDIDTRSDVYSLGVLLYEVLTGVSPFDKDTLNQVGIDEMWRMIREDEPCRPSDRVSTLAADAASTICDQRKVHVRGLVHSIRGELDWIVMKAMEKDRNRRYESASALAEDIERYLEDKPVLAGPPTLRYRLQKLARRKKGVAVVVAVVTLSLLTGVSFGAWQLTVATEQRNRAHANAVEAKNQKRSADEQRQIAIQNLQVTLSTLNDILEEMRKPPRTQTEANARVRILTHIRELMLNLKESQGFSSKTHISLLEIHTQLGAALYKVDKINESFQIFRDGINLAETCPRSIRGSQMVRLARANLHNAFGFTLVSADARDRIVEAEQTLEMATSIAEKLAKDFPNDEAYQSLLLQVQINYAAFCLGEGEYAAGESILQRDLEQIKRGSGPLTNLVIDATLLLAMLQKAQGKYQEAEQSLDAAILRVRNLINNDAASDSLRKDIVFLLGRCFEEKAQIAERTGRKEKALNDFSEALACFEEYLPRDPLNNWCNDRIAFCTGAIQRLGGAPEEATSPSRATGSLDD